MQDRADLELEEGIPLLQLLVDESLQVLRENLGRGQVDTCCSFSDSQIRIVGSRSDDLHSDIIVIQREDSVVRIGALEHLEELLGSLACVEESHGDSLVDLRLPDGSRDVTRSECGVARRTRGHGGAPKDDPQHHADLAQEGVRLLAECNASAFSVRGRRWRNAHDKRIAFALLVVKRIRQKKVKNQASGSKPSTHARGNSME